MRLICPNCDAQYEVGDGVIPPEGRDVQCSNCGHTWFQVSETADGRPDEPVTTPPPHVAQPRSRGMRQDSRIHDPVGGATAAAAAGQDVASDAATDAGSPQAGQDNGEAAAFFGDVAADAGDSQRDDTQLYEDDEELAGSAPTSAPAADDAEEDEFEASLRAALGDDGLPEDGDDEEEGGDHAAPDADRATPEDPAGTSLPAGGPLSQREQIPRRPLDPEVAEVLREEARREAEARRAEINRLESQPDLGLDSGAPHDATAARSRLPSWQEGDEPEMPAPSAQASAQAAAEAGAAGAAAGAHGHATAIPGRPGVDQDDRSEMFPDIEEVNSSLTATTDRSADPDAPVTEEDAAEESQRTGFRLGFLLMVLLAAAGVALYRFAPEVVDRIPEAGPLLDRYVETVDVARLRLDDWARLMVEKIGNLGG
ncbi:hypothetical protein BV394_07345 [Brevirhabdus pacifica]|uniref:Uncharacterized protein n=2 Tax=Brevirhabdus pacifica TaxID=1267768 RepID=A0A1U7DHW2_9RHOB|nr:zinc-ribbon domain-containing protein [Brevirhabdus pacifica]APX89551.1 hypothetical protein BV394_07345 [Brevirhabdus pacifica]PJJ85787.1 putative Zn finger-like uncharacterized protein [Brevirhabdus pacifica]